MKGEEAPKDSMLTQGKYRLSYLDILMPDTMTYTQTYTRLSPLTDESHPKGELTTSVSCMHTHMQIHTTLKLSAKVTVSSLDSLSPTVRQEDRVKIQRVEGNLPEARIIQT